MPRQISGRPDGSNPLIYTGSVPNMVIKSRRPNSSDVAQYELGYWWVIPKQDSSPTEEIWILISKDNNIATWKRLGGSSSGSFVNKIVLTTPGSGTYIPTPGMVNCYVECIGGGGSGNTVNTACATAVAQFGGDNLYCNAPGGAGGYCAKLYTAAQIGASQVYTVGAGGIAPTANANANGNQGTETTFMSMIAYGGLGSTYISNGASNEYAVGGPASGGDINMDGGNGTFEIIYNTSNIPLPFTLQSNAGVSFYGKGFGYLPTTTNATTGASGSNGAGGGSVRYNTAAGSGLVIGGTGGDGLIVITEYIG